MIDDLRRLLMWHQKAKGPPDGPPIFLIFVEKLNCPQSQAYQSISPVGTGLSLTDRALGVSLGTSIGNYSPLIAPQPVKLKIHRWQHRTGSSPVTGTTSEQSPLCSDVFYAYGKKDVIRPLPCSSFPNRNRWRWVAVWVPKCARASCLST